MVEINKVRLWQAANNIEKKMRALGIVEMRYSTDLTSLEKTAASMEKKALGEHFKKSLNTLPPNRVMWISALDEDRNVAGVLAARLDDIGSWSLQRFIIEHFGRVVEDKYGNPSKLKPHSTQFAANIHGKCAYMGEGYSTVQWRNKGLMTMMSRYLNLIMWDEWKPTIIYGWMRRKQAETGGAVSGGFTECYETPLEFEIDPKDMDWCNTFFVGLRAEGIHQMIVTQSEQASRSALRNKEEKPRELWF